MESRRQLKHQFTPESTSYIGRWSVMWWNNWWRSYPKTDREVEEKTERLCMRALDSGDEGSSREILANLCIFAMTHLTMTLNSLRFSSVQTFNNEKCSSKISQHLLHKQAERFGYIQESLRPDCFRSIWTQCSFHSHSHPQACYSPMNINLCVCKWRVLKWALA